MGRQETEFRASMIEDARAQQRGTSVRSTRWLLCKLFSGYFNSTESILFDETNWQSGTVWPQRRRSFEVSGCACRVRLCLVSIRACWWWFFLSLRLEIIERGLEAHESESNKSDIDFRRQCRGLVTQVEISSDTPGKVVGCSRLNGRTVIFE